MRDILILLREERRYGRLLLASLLSGLGDWLNSVALLSLLLQLTGSGLAVGIMLATRTLPYLFIGPVAGWLADRVNRKTILLVSDFARAGAALSFLFIRNEHDIWIAYAGTLALVIFSALFSPARTAVIPQLVGHDHVVLANSLEQSNLGFVMMVGSALGGVATAGFGPNTAFIINAVSFLASGFLCWSIQFPNDHLHAVEEVSAPEGGKPNPSLWEIVRCSRVVQIVTLQGLFWSVGGGGINVLLSVYGFQVFHGGNVGVGMLYGSLGLGFLISGFITHHFSRFIRQAIVGGFLVEGLGHAFMSQSPNLWIASLCLMIATMGGGVCTASVTTLIMYTVQKQAHGRIFALFDATSNVVFAFSMIAAGSLLTSMSPRTLGLASGLLIVLAAVVTGLPLFTVTLPAGIMPRREDVMCPTESFATQ